MPRHFQFSLRAVLAIIAAWLTTAFFLKSTGFGWIDFFIFGFIGLIFLLARKLG